MGAEGTANSELFQTILSSNRMKNFPVFRSFEQHILSKFAPAAFIASSRTHLRTSKTKYMNLIYRDRLSGSRDGYSAIAWYHQPLPGTRPSYSINKPVGLGLTHLIIAITQKIKGEN